MFIFIWQKENFFGIDDIVEQVRLRQFSRDKIQINNYILNKLHPEAALQHHAPTFIALSKMKRNIYVPL